MESFGAHSKVVQKSFGGGSGVVRGRSADFVCQDRFFSIFNFGGSNNPPAAEAAAKIEKLLFLKSNKMDEGGFVLVCRPVFNGGTQLINPMEGAVFIFDGFYI